MNNEEREFSHPFPDMKHGFVSRGDMNDVIVKRDKELALSLILNFLIQHTS